MAEEGNALRLSVVVESCWDFKTEVRLKLGIVGSGDASPGMGESRGLMAHSLCEREVIIYTSLSPSLYSSDFRTIGQRMIDH